MQATLQKNKPVLTKMEYAKYYLLQGCCIALYYMVQIFTVYFSCHSLVRHSISDVGEKDNTAKTDVRVRGLCGLQFILFQIQALTKAYRGECTSKPKHNTEEMWSHMSPVSEKYAGMWQWPVKFHYKAMW